MRSPVRPLAGRGSSCAGLPKSYSGVCLLVRLVKFWKCNWFWPPVPGLVPSVETARIGLTEKRRKPTLEILQLRERSSFSSGPERFELCLWGFPHGILPSPALRLLCAARVGALSFGRCLSGRALGVFRRVRLRF